MQKTSHKIVIGIIVFLACGWVIFGIFFCMYRSPSASMAPTLVPGDLIVAKKWEHGQRGDIMVFKSPSQENTYFVKRIIGMSGDIISYYDKKLTINGKSVPKVADGNYEYTDISMGAYTQDDQQVQSQKFRETLGGKTFHVLNIPSSPPIVANLVQDFPLRKNCQYDEHGFICKVPEGYYFMMGDNRDNSMDSRYSGFLEERLLVGKVFFVGGKSLNLESSAK